MSATPEDVTWGECKHCLFTVALKHQDEHAGLCCDCLDLSCGMPLEDINAERADKGQPPITRHWERTP